MGLRTTVALIAALCSCANSSAATAPNVADAAPAAATPAVSILDPKDVLDILNHTVLWYRTLGTQQQFADEPSDQLILFANRQNADQVVALAFQIARADAELYSNEVSAHASPADSSSPQGLSKVRDRLVDEAKTLQSDIDAKKKAAAKPGKVKPDSDDKLNEEEGKLDMLNARANLLGTMLDFATQSNPETRRAATLKAQIDAIAATIPAANAASATATPGSSPTAPQPTAKDAERAASGRTGLWDLGSAVWRLHTKMATIARLRESTQQLSATFEKYQGPSREQLLRYTQRSDELASAAEHADAGQQGALRGKFDTLAWFFNQTSAIFIPLANEHVLLGQYIDNLNSWSKDTTAEYREAWITLGKRMGIVLGILVGVFIVGEIWRRAVLSLAHERSRLYQLLLVRRVVLWVAVIVVIGLSVVTEISSFATFAGLLTAGTAVAMQSVLVSVVGYFFLIGKYGVRIGDRVQIGTVVGEVIDIGLVRMHLMEYNTTGPLGPTGRVVAFANLIVFQASGGLFKQLSGTSLAWHEMTVTLPAVDDYAVLKGRLMAAIGTVVDAYRHEFASGADTAKPTPQAELQPQVHMRLAGGKMDALIRYPVSFAHAAEIDEQVSEAVLKLIAAHGP
jgi:small-conductance mechanosensitive channel